MSIASHKHISVRQSLVSLHLPSSMTEFATSSAIPHRDTVLERTVRPRVPIGPTPLSICYTATSGSGHSFLLQVKGLSLWDVNCSATETAGSRRHFNYIITIF